MVYLMNDIIGDYYIWESYAKALHLYHKDDQNQAIYCTAGGAENNHHNHLPLSCADTKFLRPLDSFPINVQRAIYFALMRMKHEIRG